MITSKFISCNLCGTDDFKVLGYRRAMNHSKARGARFRRVRNGTIGRIAQCKHCGLIYANPIPIYSNEDIEDMYSDYYYRDIRNPLNNQSLYAPIVEKTLSAFLEASKGKKILDVGCGQGELLFYFKQKAWRVYGVEVSRYCSKCAYEKYGIEVCHGDLLDANFPSNYLDVVYVNSVLEHVLDPRSLLKEMYRILRPKGLLYVGVPNADSLAKRVGNLYFRAVGTDWTTNLCPLFPPFHLYGFTSKTLRSILRLTDFSIIQMVTASDGAFFPFCDTIRERIESGIRRVVCKIGNLVNMSDFLIALARK